MTKINFFFLSLLLFSAQATAELGYRPYSTDYIDGEAVRTYYETEEELDQSLEPRRVNVNSHLEVSENAHSLTNVNLQNLILEDALTLLLDLYEAGQILHLTNLKDAPSVIEQRIIDKEAVALIDKPFRRFLQSSFCLLTSIPRYFIDPLCFKERENASSRIEELQNNIVWFNYIVDTTTIKIVEDENGQKGFSVFQYNLTLNPFASSDRPLYVFTDQMTSEELALEMSQVYYYHSLRREMFRDHHVSTKLFRVYEVGQ